MAGAAEGVDHNQELHQPRVDRGSNRLNDEDVALADVFLDLDEDVLVAELEDLDPPGRAAEVIADRPRQRGVRVATENAQLLVHPLASCASMTFADRLLVWASLHGKGGFKTRPYRRLLEYPIVPT